MNLSDDELIKEYLQGNVDSFGHLYDRYERRLFGFVLSLGGTWERAEDVVQKTWLKVLDQVESYRMQGRFRAWLFTIGHRVWLDEVRSAWERRRVSPEGNPGIDYEGLPIDESLMRAAESPVDQAARKERLDIVYSAIERLPDMMRQALLLRIDAGMTHKEISEVMHCPLGTTLWRVREATQRLKDQLKGV